MRRTLLFLVSLLFCLASRAQTDSSRVAILDNLLDRYMASMETESVETKSSEADYIINSLTDKEFRQRAALRLFDHYKDSPLMGDEAVAVHLYDKWFADGSIEMRSEFDKLDAELFANFNRETLLGCDAPVITLRTPCGRKMTVPNKGETTVMFFFDTSCAKCRVESEVLPSVLAQADFPLKFCAVYCGQDRKGWRKFRRSFKVKNPNVKVVHLWDPEIESGYLSHYGVISTPRMYLIDPDGTVTGRRLEVETLQELLPYAGAIQRTWSRHYGNNQ